LVSRTRRMRRGASRLAPAHRLGRITRPARPGADARGPGSERNGEQRRVNPRGGCGGALRALRRVGPPVRPPSADSQVSVRGGGISLSPDTRGTAPHPRCGSGPHGGTADARGPGPGDGLPAPGRPPTAAPAPLASQRRGGGGPLPGIRGVFGRSFSGGHPVRFWGGRGPPPAREALQKARARRAVPRGPAQGRAWAGSGPARRRRRRGARLGCRPACSSPPIRLGLIALRTAGTPGPSFSLQPSHLTHATGAGGGEGRACTLPSLIARGETEKGRYWA
jgi:hypothetical protein